MDSSVFLQDFALVLLAAGFAAILCHRLRQPKMLGYVLAGLVLGPHTPPFSFIRDAATIHTLADLGVIFLMMSLGFEFNLRRFRRVGAQAGLSALLDVGVMLWLGYFVGRQLGWSHVESLFLGGIVCDSSTTVLVKTLQETGRGHASFAGYVIGVTVVEDVLAVALIAVLTGLAVTGSVDAGLLVGSLWGLVVFLGSVTTIGLLTLPRLLNHLHRADDEELLILPLVGICFGVAMLATRLHLSAALGAVLIGAIASESRAVRRVSALIDPLRHIFSAVFFVAIGLLLDPAMLLRHWGAILLVTGVVMGGKFLTSTVGALLTGHNMPTSLRSAAALAQIAEFALIIAALGLSLGAISDPVYQVGVAAAILTTLLSPPFMRCSDRLADWVERSPNCRRCTACFQLYGDWAQRIRGRPQSDAVRRSLRRLLIVILVNGVLFSAALGCAAYAVRRLPALLPALTRFHEWIPAICWLAATLVCLPLVAGTLRTLDAVSLILAEMVLPISLTSTWARHMRAFVGNAVLAAGSVGLVLLILILSSAILPSRNVLLVLMVGTVLLAWWRWPRWVQLYAQAHSALESVFTADTHESAPHDGAASAATLAMALHVESALVPPDSPVVGQSLSALGLRARTGATVVGIRRERRHVVNPGPDEILAGGDDIFLFGSRTQVQAARRLLAGQGEHG